MQQASTLPDVRDQHTETQPAFLPVNEIDAPLFRLMPALFRELATSRPSVPLRVLLMLAEKFGGTEVRVPNSVTARTQCKLVRFIHRDDLEPLCSLRGGEKLSIPQASRLRTEIRRRRIFEMARAGESRCVIAQRFHLAERSVYRIVQQMREKTAAAAMRNTSPAIAASSGARALVVTR